MPLALSPCVCACLSARAYCAQLNVCFNRLGADGEAAIKEAVSGKKGFKLYI